MSSGRNKPNLADQSEALPRSLRAMLAESLFPGRVTLRVAEVAKALRVDEHHVVSLIEENLLVAVKITGAGNLSRRSHWRIPVGAWDHYIKSRSNHDRRHD